VAEWGTATCSDNSNVSATLTAGASDFVAVAGFLEYDPRLKTSFGVCFGIKSNATLWGWGHGQYGIALTSRPQQVAQWTNVAKIVGSKDSAALYVLLTDGSVYSVGGNQYGELGIGNTTDSSAFRQVAVLSSIVDIAAGMHSAYALDTDGTVWSWGNDLFGELGREDGSWYVPFEVVGLPRITAIGAGFSTAFAIDDTGQLWAWGNNAYGALGLGEWVNGTSSPRKTSVVDAVSVDGGLYTSYVIRGSGTLLVAGQDVSTSKKQYFFTPTSMPSVRSVSTTVHCTAVVDSTGTVWVWGVNKDSRLGVSADEFGSEVKQPLKTDITGAKEVYAGALFGLVLFG
jgi:alpha-tubulin suppressor-like RCC1 family protein